ncbi:hypothetical protein H6802_01890 [Candidatus Nomurabacteria bacterium]|uniref:Uncharacterized protein n=1 Tax=candidate division WWE3 bacterium TaxID=2053526 RepID=A0A955E113_UNCKA|nr:hypothetical protein [candidate division WWE3 bacterium]MCB9823683.1 hypothetical protein [Candidatus Nomurabacteria bacterium]MCB9827239.1 hypothetical protein [Candidatus Nomurabacteria bacterium]MCB9827478.1 hypothetical protein [Candidatus Nomurabacteria bacterium]HXK52508.1 hypothetical protein [bacterium]
MSNEKRSGNEPPCNYKFWNHAVTAALLRELDIDPENPINSLLCGELELYSLGSILRTNQLETIRRMGLRDTVRAWSALAQIRRENIGYGSTHRERTKHEELLRELYRNGGAICAFDARIDGLAAQLYYEGLSKQGARIAAEGGGDMGPWRNTELLLLAILAGTDLIEIKKNDDLSATNIPTPIYCATNTIGRREFLFRFSLATAALGFSLARTSALPHTPIKRVAPVEAIAKIKIEKEESLEPEVIFTETVFGIELRNLVMAINAIATKKIIDDAGLQTNMGFFAGMAHGAIVDLWKKPREKLHQELKEFIHELVHSKLPIIMRFCEDGVNEQTRVLERFANVIAGLGSLFTEPAILQQQNHKNFQLPEGPRRSEPLDTIARVLIPSYVSARQIFLQELDKTIQDLQQKHSPQQMGNSEQQFLLAGMLKARELLLYKAVDQRLSIEGLCGRRTKKYLLTEIEDVTYLATTKITGRQTPFSHNRLGIHVGETSFCGVHREVFMKASFVRTGESGEAQVTLEKFFYDLDGTVVVFSQQTAKKIKDTPEPDRPGRGELMVVVNKTDKTQRTAEFSGTHIVGRSARPRQGIFYIVEDRNLGKIVIRLNK